MFCFIDILFVILLMYYTVCHIVFWDYNCSFAIFLIICMTISTSNGILLPNKDLWNVNKWWWFRWHELRCYDEMLLFASMILEKENFVTGRIRMLISAYWAIEFVSICITMLHAKCFLSHTNGNNDNKNYWPAFVIAQPMRQLLRWYSVYHSIL
jgi:hypothetical protein